MSGTLDFVYSPQMKAVTIREAKARLNALVEAAIRGEQVVLMRGSKHVAAIVPVSADDLELSPKLTDSQANRLWQQLHEERDAGMSAVFRNPKRAVHFLRAIPKDPKTRGPSRKSSRTRQR